LDLDFLKMNEAGTREDFGTTGMELVSISTWGGHELWGPRLEYYVLNVLIHPSGSLVVCLKCIVAILKR
jgi:hypothetical protein